VPLKIYSYLHSGKPIVATDLPAHAQVLNAEMAVLVAPTEEAFADGILALAQSPDLRKRIGLRGQQFVRERFDPADYLAKLDRLYQALGLPTSPSEQADRSPQSDQALSPQQQWLRLP
jgi:glycosyltransferase involved in cell wall biosynthesis